MSLHEEQATQMVDGEAISIAPLAHKVAFFQDELDERRRQLSDDLAYFELKLKELDRLDPLDFTGLAQIYIQHAENIRNLLGVNDTPELNA
jgi:hypothetical protein